MICRQVDFFVQWRKEARALLLAGVAPEAIAWNSASGSGCLFADEQPVAQYPMGRQTTAATGQTKGTLEIPKRFMQAAQQVACYRDPGRWALLYRIAYRLIYENKALLDNLLDPDIKQFYRMLKSISRDKHKMAAFVRFQKVNCINDPDDEDYFVAWFEPAHLIVPLKIGFFVKRFTHMRWSILTPDMCAHWDGQNLQLTPGVTRPANLHDELEALWQVYYKNIFNPARLKIRAMQSEMPKKYWRNLPEAALIKTLIRQAQYKTDSMLSEPGFSRSSKTDKSRLIRAEQAKLRHARRLGQTH